MSFKVVILNAAKQDLKELRDYIVRSFSHAVWLSTSLKTRDAMEVLGSSPQIGNVPPELELLRVGDYRQVISGMNRIIYEVRQDVVFIHAVVDVRRDMVSLLTKRLLRSSL